LSEVFVNPKFVEKFIAGDLEIQIQKSINTNRSKILLIFSLILPVAKVLQK